MIVDLGLASQDDIPADNFPNQHELLKNNGCFVGFYTFEIDTMMKGGDPGKIVLKTVYSELRSRGQNQQKNFDDVLDANNFWSALNRIEGNISKGRFAQRFASHLSLDLVPDYIQNAITEIIKKVTGTHE